MSEIEAERNLYKGKYRALLKLISRTRSQLVHVTDHIEDEGDRAYFGSTNDADALKALYREMMSWIWDATDETNRMKADPYATIRDLRTRIAALEAENERLRKALGEWQPIASCPFREPVDLWCIYGGEEYARYDGGASIGQLVSNRHRTKEYGFFGNQSNEGVPQRDAPDLVPVAWRPAVQQCPAELIAEVRGIPITLEAARAALEAKP